MSDLIPEGTYKARATGGDFGESPEKKSAYVRAGLVITRGDHKGEALAWDGYFSDATAERTIESLKYFGCTFPGGDVTNLEGITANEVSITVKHELSPTNGRVFARVAWVNAGAGGVMNDQKMSQKARASLSGRMKSLLSGTAPTSRSLAADRSRGQSGGGEFEDNAPGGEHGGNGEDHDYGSEYEENGSVTDNRPGF